MCTAGVSIHLGWLEVAICYDPDSVHQHFPTVQLELSELKVCRTK